MEEQRKILVIEDEPGLRTTLAELLEINGYEVQTAKDERVRGIELHQQANV